MFSADALGRLTTQSIHFVTPDDLAPIWDDLVDYDLHVLEIDADPISNEQGLLDAISDAADEPEIKENWDALLRFLVDGGRANASGIVLAVRNAGALWREHPEIAGALTEVWLAAAESGVQDDFATHLVFELPGALTPLAEEPEDDESDPFIRLEPVESEMLRAAGYDPRRRILELEFHDRRVYRYYRVPNRVYRGLLEAESAGIYFQNAIRGSFPYAKVSK